MKKHAILLLALVAVVTSCALPLKAQTTTLTIYSGAVTLKNFYNLTPLSVGDVVELGYYTNATATNPFSGTFVALSGGSISNTAMTPTADGSSFTTDTVHTVIGGDQNTGAGPGEFGYILLFQPTTPNVPQNGQIMTMMFFNNTTVASSTAFGAASNATWLWENSTAQLDFSLDYSMSDPGTVWLANDVGFTGVPEPQTIALLPAGLLLLYFARRWTLTNRTRLVPRRVRRGKA